MSNHPIKLVMLAQRPVYYHAPLYRAIAADERVTFTAVFASNVGASRSVPIGASQVDFGGAPLDGYESLFLRRARFNTPNGFFTLRDWDVTRLVRRLQPDVLWLHGYNTLTHTLALATQRLRRAPVLVRDEQTLLAERPRWKTAAKNILLPRVFHGAYGLYIGSENRRWLERWGIEPDRLYPVPYCVDNDALQTAVCAWRGKRAEARASFGIAGNGPVVLSVARLAPEKRPLTTLDVFRYVRNVVPCTLLFVGTGPLESEIRDTVRRQGIPDVVIAGFLGQDDIARAYAAADVFVLLSSYDPWGLVVNEAMNAALPVLVSDRVGSSTDLVADGHNGFVVPDGDLPLARAALETLVKSPEMRRKFGEMSLETVSEWNYDRAAQGVISAALTATTRRPPRLRNTTFGAR